MPLATIITLLAQLSRRVLLAALLPVSRLEFYLLQKDNDCNDRANIKPAS
jgi:hypothetical protein